MAPPGTTIAGSYGIFDFATHLCSRLQKENCKCVFGMVRTKVYLRGSRGKCRINVLGNVGYGLNTIRNTPVGFDTNSMPSPDTSLQPSNHPHELDFPTPSQCIPPRRPITEAVHRAGRPEHEGVLRILIYGTLAGLSVSYGGDHSLDCELFFLRSCARVQRGTG